MNFSRIKALLDFIKDTDIIEVEVEEDGRRIRLRREEQTTAAGAAPESAPEETENSESDLHAITAPRVGTFHFSSRRDGEGPIRKGTAMRVGQLVGYVEAMDVRQELIADRSGRVRAVLIKNGHPVEYGQKLFLIEPE